MNKKLREEVYNKFGGMCAYSGTPLKDDWQVDHVIPQFMVLTPKFHGIEHHDDFRNLMPVQRIINHYKRGLFLDDFRGWYLGKLHTRLKRFPKKTNSPRTIARKMYLLEVAELFGITEDKPFNGKFYFETLEK